MAVAKIQKEVDVDAESPTAVKTKDVSCVEDCTWAAAHRGHGRCKCSGALNAAGTVRDPRGCLACQVGIIQLAAGHQLVFMGQFRKCRFL